MLSHLAVTYRASVKSGFTLVEISIVLVVIGLLVGGVVAGQSLIRGAEIRGTIAQVNGIKTAASAFREKFEYLPGDIPTAQASQLQLTLSSSAAGNGDGIITVGTTGGGDTYSAGEAAIFFPHLSETQFLNGAYGLIGVNESTATNGKQISDYLPKAKLGGEMYFTVWNGGPDKCRTAGTCAGTDGYNYLSISSMPAYYGISVPGIWSKGASMPVMDAYSIDSKVDDGLPQSGNVLAFYLATETIGLWAGTEYAGAGLHLWNNGGPTTQANPASAINCYDNDNTAGQPQRYSMGFNGGESKTCALSFRM